MRKSDITKLDSKMMPSAYLAGDCSVHLSHFLRILDDCLLNDSEFEQFRQSALKLKSMRASALIKKRSLHLGTMDTHPPDTYFGIEVAFSVIQNRSSWQISPFPLC